MEALKVSDQAAYQANTDDAKLAVRGVLAYIAKNIPDLAEITKYWYTKVYQFAADKLPKGNDKSTKNVSEVNLSTDPTAKEYSVTVAAAITAQDGKVPDWLQRKSWARSGTFSCTCCRHIIPSSQGRKQLFLQTC